ncbi:MAG: hypothetical protein HIU83_11505 [Proteobacteria bacterium]|nr:hypothetical protein [Pseudomonadota bacterium]
MGEGLSGVENRNDDRIVFISLGMVDGKTEKIFCLLENISPGGAPYQGGGEQGIQELAKGIGPGRDSNCSLLILVRKHGADPIRNLFG